MLNQLLRRQSVIGRIAPGLLFILLLPAVSFASSLPKPTDRWLKTNGSVTGNLPATALSVPVKNALPDGHPDIKVGSVIVSSDGTTMTVKQGTDRALIDWPTFNIGSNNTVRFEQPGSDSVALNRITQQSPSKIFGHLEANGNVWLFNPNGIFFGRGSQVNVRGLIASTMQFNGLDETNFAKADLFGAINQGKPFLTNARLLAEGSSYCVGPQCSVSLNSDPLNAICSGDACNSNASQAIIQGNQATTCIGADCRQLLPRIIVQQGADINTGPGGPLLLAAPEVINEGELHAGDGGQAIMAGSKKDLYLAVTSKDDTNMRGFIVEVDSGSAHPEGGTVVNAGDVTANLGNVTLVAKEVVQAGRIHSMTAVDANGSIRLIARDGGHVAKPLSQVDTAKNVADALYLDGTQLYPNTKYIPVADNPGTVIMQDGSSMRVDIDSSGKTANDSLPQPKSQVHIEGKQVYMGKGAEIVAPGGTVTVRARSNPIQDLKNPDQWQDNSSNFIMDDGAVIDVSGTKDTVLGADRNTLNFFITSNELKDAPQQKNGPLLRETVKVDIRKGTPLFDWTKGLASVEKTASERNAAGGTIDVKAGAVALGANTKLDVSGGYVTFKGGIVESSRLLGNKLIDISNADVNMPYQAVISGGSNTIVDPKWGERKSFRPGETASRYYRPTYKQGDNAGYLRILAGQQDIDPSARFLAGMTTGPYQRTVASAPTGGVLVFDAGIGQTDIYIHNDLNDFGNDLVNNSIRLLASQLQDSGANKLGLHTDGVVHLGTQDAPLSLNLGLGRSAAAPANLADADSDLQSTDLLVDAAGIDMVGTLRAPSANINFVQADVNKSSMPGYGVLRLDGTIDTSGRWINDRTTPAVPSASLQMDGGSVLLQSDREIHVTNNSLIRTDAGAWTDASGHLTIGKAGDIALRNTYLRNDTDVSDAVVDIGGQFSAIDGGSGGTLTLEAENFTIGGNVPTRLTNQAVVGNDFFRNTDVGGFRFIAGNGSVTVNDAADINLFHKVLSAPESSPSLFYSKAGGNRLPLDFVPSSDSVAGILDRTDWRGVNLYRAAASSLQLQADRPQPTAGDAGKGIVALLAGSRINGAPGSTVSINSANRSLLDGSINIAGGTVSATNTTFDNAQDADTRTYILVGDNAKIDLSASALPIPSGSLEQNYKLVDAGTVNLTATVGSVITSPGADIRLRGATVQSRGFYVSQGGASGAGGRILSDNVQMVSPVLKMSAGTFNLEAEKGFALGNVVDFGAADANGDGKTDYTGGTLSLRLNYDQDKRDRSPSRVDSTVDVLQIALGDSQGLQALKGFSFGDALPAGYISGESNGIVTGKGIGFVNTGNLSGNHLDSLTIATRNSFANYQPPKTALSYISAKGDVNIAAESRVVMQTNWLDVGNGALTVSAPYVQLGIDSEVRNTVDQSMPTAPADLVGGSGKLTVDAGLIDLVGNLAVTGSDKIALNASSAVRTRSVFSVNGDTFKANFQNGSFNAFGNLAINTPVLYGATLSNYDFNLLDGGAISVGGYTDPASGKIVKNGEPVLSYGAQLGFNAGDISVDTAIRAPFGAIDLNAQNNLLLSKNGLLSVAAVDNTRIPLGRTQGGNLYWTYTVKDGFIPLRFNTSPSSGETALPEKNIQLSGKNVDAQQGSVIDLSGGGQVFATEFVAGLGGSKDILNEVPYTQRFVLVKGLTSGFAPFDIAQFRNSQIPFGTSLQISGSKQLPDGVYTVLPASYAFLQGAYVVEPYATSQIITPGFRRDTTYDAEIVGGRLGNASGTSQSNWQAFRIEPGFRVSGNGTISDPRAEYHFATLDNYFGPAAPGALPQENGRLAIDVIGNVGDQLSLLLASAIRSSISSRVGSSVDIASNQDIVISDTSTAAPGQLLVSPSLVDDTGADSILIGGRRSWSAGQQAWQVVTDATNVQVDGVALDANELLLTATNQVSLTNGAAITTSNYSGFTGSNWLADNNAATLLSSTSQDSRLLTTDGAKNYGAIDTGDGTIDTSGALAVAYDGSNGLRGIHLDNARLQVFSHDITLGSGADATLDQTTLQSASDLELETTGQLRVTDNTDINNVTDFTLRGSQIDVLDGVNFSVTAGNSISLQALYSDAAAAPQRASTLTLRAPNIDLASASTRPGTLSISSADVNMNADRQMSTGGDVALAAAGNLTVSTPLLLARKAGQVNLTAADTLRLNAPMGAGAPVIGQFAAGASYRLRADTIDLDTALWAPAGIIDAQATHALTVGANAKLAVPSVQVAFPDGPVTSPEGMISLIAGGNLSVASVNAFDFGVDSDPGNGGSLELRAGGALTVDTGGADAITADGGRDVTLQGDTIDVGSLLWFNHNGFNRDVSAISTGANGDIQLSAGDSITARDLSLIATNANLTLDSGATLNVHGNRRAAQLYAGKTLTVSDGAAIHVTAENGQGGDLSLQTPGGEMQVAAGANLDVAGNMEVVASANAAATDVQVDSGDSIGGKLFLYLSSQFKHAVLTAADFNNDVGQAITAATHAVVGNFITTVHSVIVRPLVDIFSSSSLDVPEKLDLATLRANGQPGRLVLRAAGDININGGLSDGVSRYVSGFLPDTAILLPDESWDLNLASGALNASGLAMADLTSGSHHNITVADHGFIRTGTGDINIQSSGDLLLGQTLGDKAYIATLGRADYMTDPILAADLPSWNGESYLNLWALVNDFSGFSRDSGNVDIQTAGALTGFSEQGLTPASFIQSVTADGVNYNTPGFLVVDYTGHRIRALALNELQSGIHSIGGGDVTVDSRGSIQRLGFSTPALAMGAANDGSYSITAGGNLRVTSRSDIINSAFANDGSSISVRAGGSIRGYDTALGETQPVYNDGGKNSAVSPGLFLSGSYTSINIVAGSDIQFDGMANTTVMPPSTNQLPTPGVLFNVGLNDMTGLFFSGYDTSSLALTSISGDVSFTNDVLSIKSILGSDLTDPVNGLANPLSQEERFRLLPSSVTFNALNGNIKLYDTLMLFPSTDMHLALRAGDNLSLNNPMQNGSIVSGSVYLPDFNASQLPTSQRYYQQASADFTTDATDGIKNYIYPIKPGVAESESILAAIRPATLIQRPEDLATKLYALNGSIGNNNQWSIFSPLRVDAFAGQDILNTAFAIQHSNPGDISTIRANRDLRYDIVLNGTKVADDTTIKYINIAGPGDLIVSAGRNIDLGASDGIVATGNTYNPLLPEKGASLHIYAGYSADQSGFDKLLGNGIQSPADLSGLQGLGFSQNQLNTLTLSQWFERLASTGNSQYSTVLIGAVAKATGGSYISVTQALADWEKLDPAMQLRVSVYALKELALANPQVLVNKGEFLFNKKSLGVEGFASESERRATFNQYWNGVSALIALDKLLSPEREADLLQQLPTGMDLAAFAALPIDQQLNIAIATFRGMDQTKQLLVAESVLNQQLRQSGIEAANVGRSLVGFERGFVALRRFYGKDLDAALVSAALRTRNIQLGIDPAIKPNELVFGRANGLPLNSFTDVLRFWQQDSGENFDVPEISRLLSLNNLNQLPAQELAGLKAKYGDNLTLDPSAFQRGNVSLVFSSVRSKAPGASINFNLPAGAVDVGLSADLIKSLGVKVTNNQIRTNELGVIAEFYGDINANVASAFNVNESRAFSLAGGAINLWATWGDIDAGKGAKTAVTTPAARFVVSPNSGVVTKVTPPAVSGSGIKTDERRLASTTALTPEENFYQVAAGAGPAYLATPLGVVDAGEAGIQSAGDLFIAAQHVHGADNISVGGVSVGVATTTTVSASVANAGDAGNQASDAVTQNISTAASKDTASSATAFVTIQLLDTGIGLDTGSATRTKVCADNDNCQ